MSHAASPATMPIPHQMGASHEAQFVERASANALLRTRIGPPQIEAFSELVSLANRESLSRSSDGSALVQRTFLFLCAIPRESRPPEISMDPDGDFGAMFKRFDTILAGRKTH